MTMTITTIITTITIIIASKQASKHDGFIATRWCGGVRGCEGK
jgi:hypothetical protein